jgi:hypothetical protein
LDVKNENTSKEFFCVGRSPEKEKKKKNQSSMATVSPQLVLGFCILGAGVATVIGYSLSRLFRKKVLNEHEESVETANPMVHEMSREQQEYMAAVRGRTTEALRETLQAELRKDRERQSAMMGAGEGGGATGGGSGCYFVGWNLTAFPAFSFLLVGLGKLWLTTAQSGFPTGLFAIRSYRRSVR